MNRRIFSGSKVNRDRREASFARDVIARAWQLHLEQNQPLPRCSHCGAEPTDQREMKWHQDAECIGGDERFR